MTVAKTGMRPWGPTERQLMDRRMRKNGMGMKAPHMATKAHDTPTMGFTPVTLMNMPAREMNK